MIIFSSSFVRFFSCDKAGSSSHFEFVMFEPATGTHFMLGDAVRSGEFLVGEETSGTPTRDLPSIMVVRAFAADDNVGSM